MGKLTIKTVAGLFFFLFLLLPAVAQSEEAAPETNESSSAEETTNSEKEATDDPQKAGDPESSDFTMAFNMGIGLGATVIGDETFQTLSLYPDLAFGKLGIGLDMDLRYRFIISNTGDSQVYVRPEDWIVRNGSIQDWINLYLTKIDYIRWDEKGAPLYLRAGTLNQATLGTGFTMGGYSNGLFKPEKRIFGMEADLDGRLFNFPYLGIETVVGNLSRFDVVGGRLYLRPLAGTEIPVIKALQIGQSLMADTNPFLYLRDEDEDGFYDGTALEEGDSMKPLYFTSTDIILPVLANDAISLSLFTDLAFQPEASQGVMTGFSGRLVKLITYGGQLRFLGANFLPVYFGPDYDLTRGMKYQIATSKTKLINPYTGYFASLGINLAEDSFITQVSVDGPFNPDPDADPRYRLPHLQGVLILGEDVIPHFFFDAHYDKYAIASWQSFTSFEDAVIGATVNYKSGPAVISLVADVKYNPESTTNPEVDPWDVSTRLETRINF